MKFIILVGDFVFLWLNDFKQNCLAYFRPFKGRIFYFNGEVSCLVFEAGDSAVVLTSFLLLGPLGNFFHGIGCISQRAITRLGTIKMTWVANLLFQSQKTILYFLFKWFLSPAVLARFTIVFHHWNFWRLPCGRQMASSLIFFTQFFCHVEVIREVITAVKMRMKFRSFSDRKEAKREEFAWRNRNINVHLYPLSVNGNAQRLFERI